MLSWRCTFIHPPQQCRALKRLAEMHEQGEEEVGVGKDTKKALEYYRCGSVGRWFD